MRLECHAVPVPTAHCAAGISHASSCRHHKSLWQPTRSSRLGSLRLGPCPFTQQCAGFAQLRHGHAWTSSTLCVAVPTLCLDCRQSRSTWNHLFRILAALPQTAHASGLISSAFAQKIECLTSFTWSPVLQGGQEGNHQGGRSLGWGTSLAMGPFTPIVVVVRNVMGKKEFNQFRGKAISLHSQGACRGALLPRFACCLYAIHCRVQGSMKNPVVKLA